MSFLSRLFGGGAATRGRDGGVYIRVRCNACGEIIQARINPTSELSLLDEGGYYVRKVLVGRQCFRPIEVELRYSDLGKTELSREIKGGNPAYLERARIVAPHRAGPQSRQQFIDVRRRAEPSRHRSDAAIAGRVQCTSLVSRH